MTNTLLDLPALQLSWTLALRSESKAEGTVKMYNAGVNAFLRWCEATGTTPELTKPAVRAFIADLLAGGAEPATAIARQKGLRRFSAWLADEGELDDDPLLGLKRPTEVRKVVNALTDDQLKRLFDACKGKTFTHRRDEAVVRLMMETGLRAGEAIALDVADVDLARGLATVWRGKGGKGRVVPFGPQTAAAIDR
ncbi:MAG: hypothetical protein QOK33_5717, partial [Mycobacterium sp.]|nr:hypothetical protein [Mycobacterium sp.]